MAIKIEPDDIVAVICEGKVEKSIINMLLETESLLFSKEQLLDEDLISGSCRGAKKFTERYLTFGYEEKKIIILIVADKLTNFKIKKPYDRNVKAIYHILTKPEIEMLMIHGLDLYSEFEKVKQTKKPSVFLKESLKTNVKSEKFIDDFYSDFNLLECIKLYNEGCPKSKDWNSLYDIFNSQTKQQLDK